MSGWGPGWLWKEAAVRAGTPRFGALSQHSFFSRHNPHPHRVRHIQGLNGRPVCTVKDDWLVSSSLFPHPLLKSHDRRLPAACTPHQAQSAMFSEAWRDELRELAANVGLSSPAQSEVVEPVRRQTQYSAQSGRLVPPSAKWHPRRPPSQPRVDQHNPFRDQELLVLELLGQILQTDSLRALQRWLLLAGHREKELVLGMIKQVDLSGRRPPQHFLPSGPSSSHVRRTPRQAGWCRAHGTSGGDEPETIGDAQVLEIHTEDQQDDHGDKI